jgi:hypothetical protein
MHMFSDVSKEIYMKHFLLTLVTLACWAICTAARAECVKDGKTYQTGDRVGPFTCTANGTWQR